MHIDSHCKVWQSSAEEENIEISKLLSKTISSDTWQHATNAYTILYILYLKCEEDVLSTNRGILSWPECWNKCLKTNS